MKGKIIDFSINSNIGIITGADGNRYKFTGKEWRSNKPPETGVMVDFDFEQKNAIDIYIDVSKEKPAAISEEGFYRSSDDKKLAGVCAGLAHKWKVNKNGLRFTTFVLTLFVWLPLIVYCLCWVLFPSKQTIES